MDAILLAGGFGTRLRPLTYTRPKPLLPVAGRPMVEWVLDRLPPDVDRMLVTVNWQAEMLRDHFAASDRDLAFEVVEETEPLGTGGAVKNCEDHGLSDRFFVLNADIVSSMDLAAQLRLHDERGGLGTIALKEVAPADVVHYGVAAMDDGDPARIRGFVEKPPTPEGAPSRLINAGAYVLDRSVLDRIPADRLVSMEKEIFPRLLDEGFYGSAFDGLWIDVGDPTRLRAASHALDPDVWHSGQARVDPAATVTGSVAGRRLRVDAGATLTDCVLGDDVHIADGTLLTDCIVGDGETVAGEHTGERIWTRAVPDGYPEKQVGNVLPGKP